jgi:glycosyltransferase involved in cell wall biosynthesis
VTAKQPTLLDQLRVSTSPGPFFEPDVAGRQGPRHPKVRLIAFYLPQFHPIPENDAFWGAGFTEWTNVTRALPRFVGHVQPKLPSDLGFYDLRNPNALRQQAALARRYGIGGFCFHHYWFNGRRLLEGPLNLLLADPTIDLPFCINWANENWTRRWDGHDSEVLLAQSHSPEDDVAFARSLIPIVRDPRYICIDGRPLVMVYRPGLLTEPVATMRRWRVEFARAGLPNPYIVMAHAFDGADPRLHGVQAAVTFPPHKMSHLEPINAQLHVLDPNFTGHVVDYETMAKHAARQAAPPFRLFSGVSPSWDNEARRPGCGFTLAHSTPAAYGAWLSSACQVAIDEASHEDERIVFINAWNEWAEGAYLEPDRHFGHAYLAETARVLKAFDRPATPALSGRADRIRLALVSHDAYFHGAQVVALELARSLVVDHDVALTVLLGGPGELASKFEALCRTESVPGNFKDLGAWRDAADRLVAAGITAVLCNTSVSAQAVGALHGAGLRIVQLVHELPSLIHHYQLVAAVRDAAALAAAVVFPSAYVRDRFIEVAGPVRGEAVIRHQGLYMRRPTPAERAEQRARTRRKLGITEGQRMVLGMGYGDVRKGLDLWPEIIRRVVSSCDAAVFVWIGVVEPGLLQWLQHDLRQSGMADRLIMPGTTNELSAAYAAADAFVLTSREDPFPSVVIEAMASGLPTVVFKNSGGVVELVRDAGGVTVPYLDLDAMGDALSLLLQDPVAAEAMGTALASRIGQDFEYADYAAALIALACPQSPPVSVVVPNFNYARHLRQRLESIWAQTVPVREVIILDDASSDDSAAVIAALVEESPIPVQVVRNAQNSGSVSRQWARGVDLALGEVVWIAEADDFADPGFLAAVLPAFDDQSVVLSYCESRMVDECSRVLAPNYLDYVADIDPVRWTGDYKAAGPDEVGTALAVKNTVPNVSAVVFRRNALAAVLRDHLEAMTDYRNAADWLCYIELLKQGGTMAFTARPLNSHRRHSGGVTLSSVDRRHLTEILDMQDLAAANVAVKPETRAIAMQYRRTVAEQFGIALEEKL